MKNFNLLKDRIKAAYAALRGRSVIAFTHFVEPINVCSSRSMTITGNYAESDKDNFGIGLRVLDNKEKS